MTDPYLSYDYLPHSSFLRYPARKFVLAQADARSAAALLALPKPSIRDYADSLRIIGKAYALMQEGRKMLRQNPDKNEKNLAIHLLSDAHKIGNEIDRLQGAATETLRKWRIAGLADRISRLLTIMPSLTVSEIALALTLENKEIENALGDWKLSLGSPAVWVFHTHVGSKEVAHEIRRQRRAKAIAFIGDWHPFGWRRWSLTPTAS